MRHLDLEGVHNARDLGGLPVGGGGETRWGAVVRADSLERLTLTGWAGLEAHGVRTVIDLRNDDELGRDVSSRPAGMTTLHLPHDVSEEWQASTPLDYGPHLERFPERSARVLAAVAQAPPGGVAIHCFDGRDRTGLISVLLLALAGVEKDEIVADYALSDQRLTAKWAAEGFDGYAGEAAQFLAQRGTSAAELLGSLIDEVDIEARLGTGGMTGADLAALRDRLVG
jgi:protein tyrosine/serine phosphatase